MSDERTELAKEIRAFIDNHAKLSPSFDPQFDDPEDRFTGPDSALLSAAADALEADADYNYVHSDWGSGCYKPYADAKAQAWHDDLVRRANVLRPSATPSLR
ncbi:hypothetical protein [Mesorhizobium sp. SP-1A]|uniref:hypothetical protein n=1 Tax=Mesorhizobium sp. SP-1A TaxID=3077840 RepID=UPI0028F71005|nr:hypothetical protein [Mesorhizobium sp. SP-1A]